MAHDYVEQLEAKPASFETITNDYPQCEETTMVQDTKFWPHSLSIVPAPFLDSDHTHPSAGFEGWPGAKCAVAPAESSNLSTAAATSTPRAKSSKQPGAAAPAIPATTAHPPAPLTSRGIQHDMGIPHAPISRNLIQSTMVTVTPLLAATLSPSTLVAHSPTSHQTSQVQAISDGANINVKMDMQIPYKHGQRAPGGPPPRRCPTKPEWEMTADAMIAQVPTAYEWHNMTSTISSNLLSVKSVDQPLQPQGVIPPFEEASRFERVFTIVRTFAENHSVGTTSFQMLLLACMCNILKFQGMPEDKVAEVLRICHPEITSSSVKSYLKGVKWVNGLLENLFRTWRYRAVELIPLCMPLGENTLASVTDQYI